MDREYEGNSTDEIKITPRMIAAGLQELAIVCDPFSLVSAVTAADLQVVYIAMRQKEREQVR
jgi:hypothetical protein